MATSVLESKLSITRPLAITKVKMKELYPDCDLAIFYRDPISEEEMEDRYLTNKLWRMNNLYTIVSKDGIRIPFVMNASQHIVYAASLRHSRILILKSRQQGISTFWLICFYDDSITRTDLSIGLMAQGRDEAGTLLTRTSLAWDTTPPVVKQFLEIDKTVDNAGEITFTNNSTIFIRTSFRSATLQRLHISEYGKICNKFPEKAKETKTGTLQAIRPGNTVVIESTAEGHNDFKDMWDKGINVGLEDLGPKSFLCIFLSWLDDPDCSSTVHRVPTEAQAKYFADLEKLIGCRITQKQKNFWIDQYDELGESTYQEYPATPDEAFKAIRNGSFYDALYSKHIAGKGQVVDNLYDSNLEVEVAVDLGMNDDFVLIYFQRWQTETRIIKEYSNSGEGIDHYVDHMIATEYVLGTVWLPHDAEVRELTSGKSRRDRFIELGIKNLVVLPRIPITTGIELVRKLIPNIWIDRGCTYIIKCFRNYSKEWDEKLKVWKDKPLHNEFSHGADGVRYLAMGRDTSVQTIHSKSKSKRSKNVTDGLAL